MRYRLRIFTLIFVFSALSAFSQKMKHGNATVTAANTILNEYVRVTADIAAGATTITVVNNVVNANGRFSGPLQTGDLIMVIQMQGVTMNAYPNIYNPAFGSPNNVTWGEITAYNNCGNYEFAEVLSVSGTTNIHLTCGLRNNYTNTGKIQVIRIPRLNNLTINSSASLTCPTWNGMFGGIVCVEVEGTTLIHSGASIHANERGFRGGQALTNSSLNGGGQHSHQSSDEGAEKGEGVFGYKTEYESVGGGMYCRGAGASAGGGGNMHNAGGGGGGNGGDITNWSGNGNPSLAVANWANAWNLEYAGFATHQSSGGGRGGYSFTGSTFNPLTTGPGVSWGGDQRRNVGGYGGRPLDYSGGKIFLGGGGGAGHQNNSFGGAGGIGGGIVYILGQGNVLGAGNITANGQNGGNSQGTPPWDNWAGIDGSGGGGAGGTIIINTEGSVSSVNLSANGGAGGNQIKSSGWAAPANTESEGPGGGGGGGHIAIYSGTPTRTTNGGANGTSNASSMVNFLPNGATAGGEGNTYASITPTILTAPAVVNACYGDDVDVIAALSGNVPGGTQIVWYNTAAGGSSIHTGNTLTINNITTSDTVWVGFCPGWYREQVIINVAGGLTVALPDTTVCTGQSVQLTSSGGTTYSWSPATGLNNPSVFNPIASPTTTTTYTVTATEGACNNTASVTVTISEVNATITANTAICSGQSVQLIATGGGTYAWSNPASLSNATIGNPIASPNTTTTYNVTVTNAFGCQEVESVTIQVNPLPAINLGPDTTICDGTTLTLNSGAGFSNYTWTPAGSNPTFDVTTSGTYSVTVTDVNSCSGSDAIVVNVVSQMDATITSGLSYCSNGTAVTLTAVNGGGTWSGNGITNAATGAFNPGTAGAGTHPITYEIAGTCGDIDIVNISVHQAPAINLGPDTTICDGTTLTLNSGAGFSNYAWTPAGSNPTFDVTTSGTYSVTVTDVNSCSGSDAIVVNVVSQMDATITSGLSYCSNGAAVTLTAVNGGGTWSGNGITNAATGAFNPGTAGAGTHPITYEIAGLCGDIDIVNISVHQAPAINLGPDTTICDGTTLTLNSGAGFSNYAWTPAGSNPTFDVTTSGTYSVTVTDVNSCSGSDAIVVNVVSQMDATITSGLSYCSNGAAVTLTAVNGGGTWSGNGITNAATGAFNPGTAGVGTHPITYEIAGSCGDIDIVNIVVHQAPEPDLGSITAICEGTNFILDAGSGYVDYLWSGAETTQTLMVGSGGTYSVTVTDSNGCSGSGSITMTETPWADASITAAGPFCSNEGPQTLNAAQAGGTWSGTGITGVSTGVFNPSVSGAGNFAVIYIISDPCGDSDTLDITVYQSPVLSISATEETCAGAGDGEITLIISQGLPPYTITWNTGSSDTILVQLIPGTYEVDVTDANTCISFASVELTEAENDCYQAHVYVPNIFMGWHL
jgi:hypothetical protein